jgi:chromate reductase
MTALEVHRNILAISGSLHSGSANSALVRLACSLSGRLVSVDIFESLGQLPHFNPEIDVAPAPEAVAELRAAIRGADALLIATPEYAHEMPGVLKNALDWLVGSGELYGKPVAVLSAAPSAGRGHYARQALQQTLAAQGSRVVLSATVPVTAAARRSDETAPETVAAVAAALDALANDTGGALLIAEPAQTPWNSVNARLEAPAGLQLTLFSEIESGRYDG